MDDVVILEGSRIDRHALRELWLVCWQASYTGLLGASGVAALLDELDASDGRTMLPGQDERVLLAGRAGPPIGSAVFAERQGTAYLWGCYVHPGFQRRGVGRALLAGVAERLPADTVVEASVLLASTGALAFYRDCGFVDTAEGAVELSEGAPAQPCLVMTATAATLLERHVAWAPPRSTDVWPEPPPGARVAPRPRSPG